MKTEFEYPMHLAEEAWTKEIGKGLPKVAFKGKSMNKVFMIMCGKYVKIALEAKEKNKPKQYT